MVRRGIIVEFGDSYELDALEFLGPSYLYCMGITIVCLVPCALSSRN